jgi:hypothetical protein
MERRDEISLKNRGEFKEIESVTDSGYIAYGVQ